jgi:hypothetical protein
VIGHARKRDMATPRSHAVNAASCLLLTGCVNACGQINTVNMRFSVHEDARSIPSGSEGTRRDQTSTEATPPYPAPPEPCGRWPEPLAREHACAAISAFLPPLSSPFSSTLLFFSLLLFVSSLFSSRDTFRARAAVYGVCEYALTLANRLTDGCWSRLKGMLLRSCWVNIPLTHPH